MAVRSVAGDKKWSVVYHLTNSPGGLKNESKCKTREHDSPREHCLSKEPPGYEFGEKVLRPECTSRWLWNDAFSTWTSTGELPGPRRVCVCVCVVIPFVLDVRFVDVPAGVTQEEGHKGFLQLPSVVFALLFLARKIQSFLSLVDRVVEFCVLTI